MKKFLLTAAILFAGLSITKAQNNHARIGAHIGLPLDDFNTSHNFNFGVDFSYLWEVNDVLKLGGKTGMSHFTGNDYNYSMYSNNGTYQFYIKYEDLTIVPLAITTKWNFAGKFFTGGDLGYAFFLNGSENTGALYVQPQVGINLGKNEIYLGYKGLVKDGEALASVNLGYAFNF